VKRGGSLSFLTIFIVFIIEDVEVTRLVKDVEKTIEGIPTLSSKFNLMAEIDLCLQPLRNENCQLRR
jgi:hypothetical protein